MASWCQHRGGDSGRSHVSRAGGVPAGMAVEAREVRGEVSREGSSRRPSRTSSSMTRKVSAYDLTCRSAYDLMCRSFGEFRSLAHRVVITLRLSAAKQTDRRVTAHDLAVGGMDGSTTFLALA